MKITIPIKEKTQKAVLKKLELIAKKADMAEIWLDQIKDLDLKTLLANKPLPVVCVCKRVIEKGSFKGTYKAQVDILMSAIKYGAEYIDIPLFMPEKLYKKCIQFAQKSKAKVILSHHDFKKTPDHPKLLKLSQKMAKKKPHVVKIATMAKTLADTVNMIALAKHLQSLKIPHILIAMGQKGQLSRILTPTLGGEMMFGTLDGKGKTAAGQMTVSDLRRAWGMIEPLD